MWKIEKIRKITFQDAFDYQCYLVDQKQKGIIKDDYLILLEHYPVFTVGKGGNRNNILDKDIKIITTNRGGDITFHGTEQLVGYIIMDLKFRNYDLHKYLRNIEEVIIKSLYHFGVTGNRIAGLTGVWVIDKKIASIGIGVKKGISMHGFALNINPDLSNFSKIRPCGLDSNLITSIKEFKKETISFEHVQSIIIEKFLEIF